MTKIIGVNEWSDVTLLEDGDKINGGEEGLANAQAKSLVNRTIFLKEELLKVKEAPICAVTSVNGQTGAVNIATGGVGGLQVVLNRKVVLYDPATQGFGFHINDIPQEYPQEKCLIDISWTLPGDNGNPNLTLPLSYLLWTGYSMQGMTHVPVAWVAGAGKDFDHWGLDINQGYISNGQEVYVNFGNNIISIADFGLNPGQKIVAQVRILYLGD